MKFRTCLRIRWVDGVNGSVGLFIVARDNFLEDDRFHLELLRRA